MKRYLALALASILVAGLAANTSIARDDKPATMRFEWHLEGPAEQCASQCRTWIFATGIIAEDSARLFETFVQGRDVRGAMLVLDSEGGSVLGALALGRQIRNYEMTTTVGRSIVLPANEANKGRSVISPDASCESMCAFLLLAGTRRYVPSEARVLVHQIWLGAKTRRARDTSYTAEELQLVQRDVGRLVRYTAEMGGSMELIETALRVPPWEPMYRLTFDELRRMNMTTVDHLFERESTARPVASSLADVITTSAQGQR